MLKVLNDYYLIEPDPIEITKDDRSGLTEEVIKAIKSEKLYIPEISEYAVKKYPMTGRVIAFGDTRRYTDIQVGDKVGFGPYSYAKFDYLGKEYFEICEKDLLYVIRTD